MGNKTNNSVHALVVEDSLVSQRLLDMFLKRAGFEIDYVENGLDAVKMVGSMDYDIIFLDVMIPMMDGYKVCKLLKKDPLTKGIPVVMLTSRDGTFDKVRGKMAGTNDYLTKPLKFAQLIKAIGKYFPLQNGKLESSISANKPESNLQLIGSAVKSQATTKIHKLPAANSKDIDIDLSLKTQVNNKENKENDDTRRVFNAKLPESASHASTKKSVKPGSSQDLESFKIKIQRMLEKAKEASITENKMKEQRRLNRLKQLKRQELSKKNNESDLIGFREKVTPNKFGS